MSSSDIRGQISYYENVLDQYYDEKASLESQIQDLEILKGRLKEIQERSEAMQQSRKNRLSILGENGVSNNLFSKYFSGMSSLLSGSEYVSANNGMSSSIEITQAEIYRLSGQLDNVIWNISNTQSTIDSLKIDLEAAIAEESQEEED